MDDTQTLVTVLQLAIDLNQGRQRQAIINFGFDTCNRLKNTTEDNLKDLFSTIEQNNHGLLANQQVRLNLTVKSRLYALREEFIMREDCAAEITSLCFLSSMTGVLASGPPSVVVSSLAVFLFWTLLGLTAVVIATQAPGSNTMFVAIAAFLLKFLLPLLLLELVHGSLEVAC